MSFTGLDKTISSPRAIILSKNFLSTFCRVSEGICRSSGVFDNAKSCRQEGHRSSEGVIRKSESVDKRRITFERCDAQTKTNDIDHCLGRTPIRIFVFVRIVVPVRIPVEAVQILLIEPVRIHPHKPSHHRVVVARAEVAQPRILVEGFVVEELPVACRGWLILCSLSVRPIVLPPDNVARRIGSCD